ncbi:hypothetical protein Calab_2754 [Caldithrix abyssi DSM 13497]|uniref:Uncharacterized protein n=1 Tax=Caldithrix abyssi DSM 13497 TaxID=880073 RepID=H1XQT9_CALAY|nr:hypothetical protein [Caldithrix abyssi]APF18350.1 hypothetical protein Cabys_1601 [Caldithrix abyssi DSM 13497]EHO42362.1 hypothetical protein Calab_2754 [Caldithrix abyssi DSM 13497]
MLSIELRSDQQRTFVGFVRNDAVALCILNKSEEIFIVKTQFDAEFYTLVFGQKAHFSLKQDAIY